MCISRTREKASFLKKCANAITEDFLKMTSQERRSPWKSEVGIRSPQEGNRKRQRRTGKNCSMMTIDLVSVDMLPESYSFTY